MNKDRNTKSRFDLMVESWSTPQLEREIKVSLRQIGLILGLFVVSFLLSVVGWTYLQSEGYIQAFAVSAMAVAIFYLLIYLVHRVTKLKKKLVERNNQVSY